MTHANAVNMCGVWSPVPKIKADIVRMRSFEETVPCTQFYESENVDDVAEWTRGAREACTEFRDLLRAFINEKTASKDRACDRIHFNRGRDAFIAGLGGLL